MARSGDRSGQSAYTRPRHVWVEFGSLQWPGVLLDWRRVEAGWEAFVMYAEGGGMTSPKTTAQWLPAAHVRPVGTT